ncbi:pyruvoyl-dependent arginine decarboxylase [Methanothermobacter sp. K4]|uniref:pyruvoyl-dependent arginine decarboxylase n=1 Tax=Methanothermobacter sp. K4 TaxID=2913262 RepID=UPI001EDBEF5D|nr:arginine decarboxylase, pyruvoyl-dependent [Methanothermobacter sp. K4]MCG2828845.1 arginine decarboxylase, pyruvoyl-dependent [Methanothermobacter sp. K4]
MKVAITSGSSEGPTSLNAFDNALLEAGIGDVNLIKVSSILPHGTEIVELPALEPGSMVNCVLSYKISDTPGDLISAAIAAATSDEFGCVVENSAVNRKPEDVREEAISMVRYMMSVRGLEINELIVEETNHVVEKCGAAVSALIYLD